MTTCRQGILAFTKTKLPLVKYDPEFAAWQSQFKPDVIAYHRELLRRELA